MPAASLVRRSIAAASESNATRIMKNERCSNPFRIPRHTVITGLRLVPQEVRNRLAHVNFGRKVCHECRMRVYKMIKERRQCKPSPRFTLDSQIGVRRRSEPVIATTSSISSNEVNTSTSDVKPPLPPSIAPLTATLNGTLTPQVAPSLENESLTMNGIIDEEPIVPSLSGNPAPPCRTRSSLPNLTANINPFPEHTMSRRNKLQLAQPLYKDGKKVCCFCGLPDENELEFGKFHEYKGIITHYYCLLLSSNMEQKGSDDQGILGFLADDILKEIRRGKRLVCSHCKKSGATLGCCNVKCKRIFHLPCGLKAGSLHQFFGEFRSYCINHRPKQPIDERVKHEVKNTANVLCYICYEGVEPFDTNNTLWAPCCKKNAWFHRQCVQQLAMSAGYFFKCPLCNNKREFQTAMLEYGIYIPRQDASWELVPNAFQELLYRHDRCDSQPCLCPKGRTYSTNSAKWELILCRLCGSQGIHVFCGQLKLANPVWECQECINITKNSSTVGATPNDSTISSNNSIIHRANVMLNISVKENEDDSDSDISVGNDSPLLDNLNDTSVGLAPIKLRPGPRSFKLQQVQKIKNNEADQEGTTICHGHVENDKKVNKNVRITEIPANVSADVICIDSDDELPEIVCESGMKSIRKFTVNHFNHVMHASSSSSSHFSSSSPFIMKSQTYDTSPIDLASPSRSTSTVIEETEESTCNFIITNVTSVPAEFFASVPDSPTEETGTELPMPVFLTPNLSNQLKRNHKEACDEEHDCEVVEAPKRARLDLTVELELAKVDDKPALPQNVPPLPENPTKAVAPPPLVGPSTASAVPENCHEDAGPRPPVAHVNGPTDDPAVDATTGLSAPGDSEPPHSESTSKANDYPELAVYATNNTVSTNGTSSFSGNNGNDESFESTSSSCNRSGLIPDLVHLSDLKFKISGNDLELAYRACKIQMKVSDMQHINSSSSDTCNAASVFSSESNQNMSSEKSSKSFPLRSDDSDESSRIRRSMRSRGPRAFVYEDDNTLLEYPTTQAHSNAGISKESLVCDKVLIQRDHNDLKENWNPEVSSSSNHIFDSPMSNQFASTPKDKYVNSSEKLIKSENDSISSLKEDSIVNQRSLRSKKLVRHFHSVQKANSPINGVIVEEKPKPTKYFPIFEKRNQRCTRSRTSSNTLEEDKHLKNVNMNDLRFTLTGTVKDMRDCKTHDVDVFKVSIDLQKIKNLITDKPDLFFQSRSEEYERMCVYKMGQKLQIELKSGEKKMLTKSRSYECLMDLAKISSRYQSMNRCKSLDNLCYNSVDDSVITTDKKDCEEKKVKCQRRKTRQFEKTECVR